MEHLKDKVSPLRQMYFKWRSLRNVPFRKKFFIGYDLDGNTYWEFYNENNPYKARRIIDYRVQTKNWSDYKMPRKFISLSSIKKKKKKFKSNHIIN